MCCECAGSSRLPDSRKDVPARQEALSPLESKKLTGQCLASIQIQSRGQQVACRLSRPSFASDSSQEALELQNSIVNSVII